MPSVTFGSRAAANRARDLPAVSEHLSPSDDRRSTIVQLSPSTPDRIVDRLQTEAFTTSDPDEPAVGGMAELSSSERSALESTGRFEWQQHGLAAMRAKGALQAHGATDFTDFYEPGEGVAGALENLRQSKKRSAQSGAGIAVGGMRTDTEEITGGRERRAQAGRMQDQQLESAKDPALIDRDTAAQEHLREEQDFGVDVWDISFRGSDRFGRPTPSGADFERLQERNEQRSERAQHLDDIRVAEKTRDPIKWANNPAEYDYPGIDTVEPEKVHGSRSTAAQERDEAELADIAPDPATWKENIDDMDLPGIDTPPDDEFDADDILL